MQNINSPQNTLSSVLEHPADLALRCRELDTEECLKLLESLALAEQARLLGYLEPRDQARLLEQLDGRRLAELVSHMEADERADLYNRLSPERQVKLLPALSQAEREDIRRMASYREETAGAAMTSDYAVLPPEATAGEALDILRKVAFDKETIYRSYVLDGERKLLGVVDLEDLILTDPGTPVQEIMNPHPKFVSVDDDQEKVVQLIAHYDVFVVPVLDHEERMGGIVTYDDAFDILEKEATEDFHKVATIGDIEGSLRTAAMSMLYRRRVVWLVLLVFANIFSGAGIAYFEDTIAANVALVFFLPLLVDSGGNAGSQSATLMVRALATGDVRMADWGRMLGRELGVATLLGLTMAVAVSSLGVLRGGPEIGLVVAITMFVVVILGSMVGMSMPFLLSRLKFDPATASAPLITSIADALGVIIYFSIATALLSV